MTAKTGALRFFTIGYERATQPAVIAELARAKIDVLVDVRAVAASRRPGFSKRQLAAALDEAGIAYLHMQKLGTPAEGRQAARAGRHDVLFAVYDAHLRSLPVQDELDALAALVRKRRRICVLCYERDVNECHRRRIAELMQERLGARIEHLAVTIA